jgi:hypothetical protein
MAPTTNLWVEGVDGEGARSHLAGSHGRPRRRRGRMEPEVVVDWKQEDKEKPGQCSLGTARHGAASSVQFSSSELSAVGEKRTNNNCRCSQPKDGFCVSHGGLDARPGAVRHNPFLVDKGGDMIH